jgi:hypothetical protein
MQNQELVASNMRLQELALECDMLSELLEEIEKFNGPKFIRVFVLWRKCSALDLSPFITRGELRNRLDNLTEMRRIANRVALTIYYTYM